MSEAYMGEIRMFAGNFAPVDWAFCDGQLLSINQYQALYALIGSQYGGDAVTTFGLPDLRGRLPIHQGTNAGVTYPFAQKAGTENVSLQLSELAMHTHPTVVTSDNGTSPNPQNNVWANATTNIFSNTITPTPMDPTSVSSVGTGAAHANVMPSLSISFIICLVGYFPQHA